MSAAGRDYAPASLGAVDSVELVSLVEVDANRVSEYMDGATGTPSVTLEGEDAEAVAALWRALPSAEQARCHVPAYGLRFLLVDGGLVEGSVCWRCNNVYGRDRGEPLHFTFDADSAPARALLARVKAALPLPASP